ncbi:MAG: hypothetical protein ACRCYP_02265 [Alphaproteobacteria bacterium]
MRKFITTILFSLFVATPIPALAFGQNDVSFDIAERGMTLAVSPEGAVVNVTTGSISAIALSDRSNFVYSQVQNSVYIKPIQRQQFEGVVSMKDGSTTLRIWVGNKILRFKVRYVSSGSRDINIVERSQFVALPKPVKQAYIPKTSIYTAPTQPRIPSVLPSPPSVPFSSENIPLLKPVATVQPDNLTLIIPRYDKGKVSTESSVEITKPKKQKKVKKAKRLKRKELIEVSPTSTPQLIVTPVLTAIAPTPKKIVPITPQLLSGSLLKGLNAARINKKVAYRSKTWNQVQDVILNLRKGTELDVAIARSRANKTVIYRFLKLGGANV